jgi:site-specific DNA-adenine methylase
MRKPHRPWTEEERAVIRAELDQLGGKRPESGYTKRLMPLLPGRDMQDVRNIFGMERRKRLGLCNCGRRKPVKGKAMCQRCIDKTKARVAEQKKAGVCLRCGQKIDPLGSLTQCSKCSKKMSERYYKKARSKASKKWGQMAAKKTKKGGVAHSYNLINWLSPCTVPFLLRVIPKGSQIVDLFGGSGDLLIRAAKEGHEAFAYNDIHPMLVAYMRVLQRGLWPELCDKITHIQKSDPKSILKTYIDLRSTADDRLIHLQTQRVLGKLDDASVCAPEPGDMNWNILIVQAALLYLVARDVQKQNMVQPRLEWVRKLGSKHRTWMREMHHVLAEAETQITCLDYSQGIKWHDSENVLFVVDPPWPGQKKYEYEFRGRHTKLVRELMGAKGRFIIIMGSTRSSMAAMAPCPYLYFLVNYGGSKLLVGSDFPLDDDGLRPVVVAEFGF